MTTLTEILDAQFAQLAADWREIIQKLDSDSLYQKPDSRGSSCGEQVVRSARIVEQTFGGITANLWDDPFEWTLPETLMTPEAVLNYLSEVEATRRRGFELFRSDSDLTKKIVTASGETYLLSLLLDTLMRAGHHLLSARELLRQFGSDSVNVRVTPAVKING